MIAIASIINRVDEHLNTGRSDARHHVTMTMRFRGHSDNTLEVDSLEAHEIYETTLTNYDCLANLLIHGHHRSPNGHIRLLDLSDRVTTMRLQ